MNKTTLLDVAEIFYKPFRSKVAYANKEVNQIIQIGDILLWGHGFDLLGKVAQVKTTKEKTCIHHIIIRPNEKINAEYLFYYLNSIQPTFKKMAYGSTDQSNIKKQSVFDLKIPLPSLPKQKAIASLIRALDDKIDLNRQTSETLEAMAQAIFKSWFVDFDMVESKLGLIPKGWEVRKIGEVLQVFSGNTPSTAEPAFWHPAEHYWAIVKDLSGLTAPVLLNTGRKISTQGLATISPGLGLLPINTLLISSRTQGQLKAVIAKTPVAISESILAVLSHDVLSPAFMLFWCQKNIKIIERKKVGSTVQRVSKSDFCDIPIIYPPADVANAFTKIADLLLEKITENELQIKTLEGLRDYLLPKLIST